MFKSIINWFDFTPEGIKRLQKCKEIQNHISWLRSTYKHTEPWIESLGALDGELVQVGTKTITDTYKLSEIEKYEGWLWWWKNTPIKYIIKEKGQDYTKW